MSYLTQIRNDIIATYPGAVPVDAGLITPIYQATPISSITLTPSALTVVIGNSITITALVAPSNAVDKTLSWSLGDGSLATLSVSGDTHTATITGVGAGSELVTATANAIVCRSALESFIS